MCPSDFNGETIGDVFQKLRVLESAWAEALGASCKALMESFAAQKEAAEKEKGDSLTDDYDENLKQLLGDKETLLGGVTSSHENHSMKLDGKEDTLMSNEKKTLEDIMEGLKKEQHARNRLRISEIFKLIDEVHAIELTDILVEEEE